MAVLGSRKAQEQDIRWIDAAAQASLPRGDRIAARHDIKFLWNCQRERRSEICLAERLYVSESTPFGRAVP